MQNGKVKRIAGLVLMLMSFFSLFAQDSTLNNNSEGKDSSYEFQKKIVTLKEVVVRNNLNVPAFITRVQEDTSFYKAFRNLRILSYTSLNDVRMLDKKGNVKAGLTSKTRQTASNGCRYMETYDEKTSGDLKDKNGGYNYFTMQMYASLFFAKDTICGENNIVGNSAFNVRSKSGMDKHKEQLKMLFFNPGKKIPGIPFIGNKIALFDEDAAELYDFIIDAGEFKGENCYIFRAIPRDDLSRSERDRIVINEMTTWFDMKDWKIVARNYDLSYNAAVYDFDVHIEVEMTRINDLVVPKVLRYNGNWDVVGKKREIGVFTATLSGFE